MRRSSVDKAHVQHRSASSKQGTVSDQGAQPANCRSINRPGVATQQTGATPKTLYLRIDRLPANDRRPSDASLFFGVGLLQVVRNLFRQLALCRIRP
jgi:hypothetical protein